MNVSSFGGLGNEEEEENLMGLVHGGVHTNESCANTTGVGGTNGTDINPFYYFEFETLTFLWILLLFIVIGNSAVLASLMLTKTQRKSRMNFFIMHLALTDLSVGLVNVLTDIIWKMTLGQWYLGNVACKLVKYFQVVVIFASNYVLVALSIDRYDAITHPLKFSGSWRRARLLIASAWGLSFTFAIPILFIFFEKELINEKNGDIMRQCWIDLSDLGWKIYITMVSFAVFIIPALIITICYTIMVHTIWTQSRILTPQGNKNTSNGILRRTCKNSSSNKTDPLFDDDSRRASSRGLIPKAKIKSVKMTFVIVFVFLCCSSPYVVFSMLQVYDFIPPTQTMTAVSTFFTSLSPLNSAANPIIYCLFSTHVGRNLRKIKLVNWFVKRICPKMRKSSPNNTNKRKFGPPGTHHHQDISQKTRTDFTSLTDSYRRPGQSSMNRFSSTTIRKAMDVSGVVTKGNLKNGGACLNAPSSRPVPGQAAPTSS
ncbi:cardioacceleratory peptide receptor isoform X2 [Folsomia candida]|uniref:cardioacceleratory peptide receptor isoform X2 n=1 Tax=Folsomia candida TaxID=158441 RepID=UPI001604D7A6|nr:cardioacceleratory peptide receptor isoform X2 [Folsomia candida]